jgi:hypothetical protein
MSTRCSFNNLTNRYDCVTPPESWEDALFQIGMTCILLIAFVGGFTVGMLMVCGLCYQVGLFCKSACQRLRGIEPKPALIEVNLLEDQSAVPVK